MKMPIELTEDCHELLKRHFKERTALREILEVQPAMKWPRCPFIRSSVNRSKQRHCSIWPAIIAPRR